MKFSQIIEEIASGSAMPADKVSNVTDNKNSTGNGTSALTIKQVFCEPLEREQPIPDVEVRL